MQAAGRARQTSDLELCLDFTDTVDWRTSEHAEDKLASYADLLAWSQKKGLLNKEGGQRLGSLLGNKETVAGDVMKDAYQLRESIYRIFSAAAHGRRASGDDIEILNRHLTKSLGKLELRSIGTDYAWAWRDTESADMMLWPIARSAADLLTSDDLARVRECANEEQGCGSLFLDCSKSQTRRWCSMESCGNRMKFKRYYDTHQRPKKA